MMISTLFSVVGQTLLYLILFILTISFLGITTGIRKAYVATLIWLFEWAARQERNAALAAGEEEMPSDTRKDSSALSTPEIETTPPPTEAPPAIIQRKWSQSIDQKLLEHIDVHNIHPLAQRATTTRRVASHGKGLQKLAEVPNEKENSWSNDDAEYATMKVLVNDTLEMLSAGIETIIEDEVTQRFETAQLPTWNFLSRNQTQGGLRIGWRSQCIWAIGVLIRYGLLFPVRLMIFSIAALMIATLPALIGYLPNERLRSMFYRKVMLMSCRMAARTFSTIINFHDTKNRPTHGICVANHTSPIDVMILSTDNCYAMVGQRQGGLLGLIEQAVSRGAHHIWFERSETRDRNYVATKLKEHVQDPTKMPILIFPEGTCINNTSVMMFKKGSFEVSDVVYPIAMKYDNRLGDPFWNSHQQGYGAYLLGMMSAWALICDVWYLPPMHRQPHETAIEFARRCQRAIARKGGLVDLGWDGNLKRAKVPERLKDEQKELFYQYLAQTTPICACGRPNQEQLENITKEIHPEVFEEKAKAF